MIFFWHQTKHLKHLKQADLRFLPEGKGVDFQKLTKKLVVFFVPPLPLLPPRVKKFRDSVKNYQLNSMQFDF